MKRVVRNSLRVLNVGYLNSVPYRAATDVEGVEYAEAPPAECARMLHEREADIALIPLADVFLHGGYDFLPLGIAARESVESVLLLSNRPIDEISTFYVDKSSHTSATLLRLLLKERDAVKFPFMRFHRMDADVAKSLVAQDGALLVIGDKAFELAPAFEFRYDLAKLWHEQSGQPFVFAVWAFRPEVAKHAAFSSLLKQFQFGIEQKRVFAREWADAHNFDRSRAETYIAESITHELDTTLLKGAEEFLRRGAASGLFPEPAAIESNESLSRLIAGKEKRVTRIAARKVDEILSSAARGKRISIAEGLILASNASLGDLALAADERREQLHRDPSVSYIVDRNINYTNVCSVYCRFCAFFRAPELNGRKSRRSVGGYILSKEEIGKKIEEMLASGGIQILLQGGLNPELGIEYYEDLFRWIKANYPVNLHALSADEILHISRVSHLTYDEVFERLIAVGLGSFPGGGAEILVDRVRQRIARLKSPAEDWLEIHRVAHRKGLTSTCTMMFGVQESWEDRLLHMHKLRHLQDETGGFTAFITWPFQDDNTKVERGITSGSEYLRVQAVARLFIDNIVNIQSSWVTMGPSVGQTALFFGANDFGSVMFEENVVSAAGTTYCMDRKTIERNILEAGFLPWSRNIHYEAVA